MKSSKATDAKARQQIQKLTTPSPVLREASQQRVNPTPMMDRAAIKKATPPPFQEIIKKGGAMLCS